MTKCLPGCPWVLVDDFVRWCPTALQQVPILLFRPLPLKHPESASGTPCLHLGCCSKETVGQQGAWSPKDSRQNNHTCSPVNAERFDTTLW